MTHPLFTELIIFQHGGQNEKYYNGRLICSFLCKIIEKMTVLSKYFVKNCQKKNRISQVNINIFYPSIFLQHFHFCGCQALKYDLFPNILNQNLFFLIFSKYYFRNVLHFHFVCIYRYILSAHLYIYMYIYIKQDFRGQYTHIVPYNFLTKLSFLWVLCLTKALKYDLFQNSNTKIFIFEYFPKNVTLF